MSEPSPLDQIKLGKKKLLLVEDDEFFRDAICCLLEDLGYTVLEAPNGKVAKDIISSASIDAIISDIQMPFFNGIELFEWVQENKKLPFIMMTGFSHLLETQSAAERGVDYFLAKPFQSADLKAILDELFVKRNTATDESVKERKKPGYCKVSLEDFVSEKNIDLNLYIKVGEKYIKILHEGGKLSEERIHMYRAKGLLHLYVEQKDFRKVIDFNIRLSKVLVKSSVTGEKKLRFLANTSNVILENTFVNGVDEESFLESKNFLETSIELLATDDQTFDILSALNGHTDYLYAHSLGVSIYSVMIAKAMGWESSASIFKLAYGGLMHDVGKKELDPEILKKPRASLTYKERAELETHPMRGKEILESLKSAPSEVVNIAFQHHENEVEMGFPRKLGKQKIHPMAKIVSVANEFCHYILKAEHSPGVSPREAIRLIDTLKADLLWKDAVEGLKKCIKD